MRWAERYHRRRAEALYLHVPFCANKCAYCDFASWAMPEGDPLMDAYVRALRAQLAELGGLGMLDGVGTAYIGGGTPTLLGARALASLVAGIRELCPHVVELSVEANPDSLSDEVLAALVRSGATRVSIGVQSLHDQELHALGRIHTARQAYERVGAAVEAGLDVSCDLMCAIPHQTDASWRDSLGGALELGVDHVSVYPLAIEEGTALARRVGAGEPAWNDPDVQACRMEQANRILSAAGLARYEVASYARPGRTCAHNRMYWTGRPYLGLGTGAASMLTREGYGLLRTQCPRLPEAPAGAVRARLAVTTGRGETAAHPALDTLSFDLEFLGERQALAEDLMLGARLSSGMAPALACAAEDAFGTTWQDVRRVALDRHLVRAASDGALVPTEAGWLLGNELYGLMWGLADGDVRQTPSCRCRGSWPRRASQQGHTAL